MYTQEQIDEVHDTFIDLIISCMKTYKIPLVELEIGDWCIEMSSFQMDHDNSVGKLINKWDEEYGKGNTDTVYEIERVGGKIITWRNATFYKIPSNFLRD